MKNASRFVAVFALLTGIATACETPAVAPLTMPAGLPLAELDSAHRALLRATLAIDGGILDETTVVLNADATTVRADVVLDNVGDGGAHVATLRIYGRDSADAEEVLLGVAEDGLQIAAGESVFVDFADSEFDSCGVGVDGSCSLLLDRNRNGVSNVDDLVRGVDPGPAAPFLAVSPSTLQFSSGIRLGSFGRQVIVTENLGAHPVRIELVQVAGGQGLGVSLFNPDTGTNASPRRRLELVSDGDDDVILAPGEELFVAVSFAPVNSFLTTAAVQVVATDVVTGVSQSSRTKVIANSDGALRPRDQQYVAPVLPTTIDLGGGAVVPQAFPANELYSGTEINGDGLVHSGSALVATLADGAVLAMPADAAYVVDVAAGQRFTGAVTSNGDVDLALLDIDDAGTVTGVVATSRQQGESAEAVELFNGGTTTQRVLLVLGRVDLSAPVAVAGALVEAELQSFRLSCQLTRGPELDDVTPIAPVHGPLEGGVPVALHGRGFHVPASSAGPHARVSFNGVASISSPQITVDADGNQTLVVTLPAGGIAADTPITVVVENPTNGGDGQAATLAEGFRYDLPLPRLTRVTPDVATIDGGAIEVVVTGAFFFDRYGPPRVSFDDVAVDALLVDSATLLVQPPAHAEGLVHLTVSNALFDGSYSDANDDVDFRFVTPQGDAPTLTSLSGATGSADGGDTITATGTGFVENSRVLLGGVDMDIIGSTATSLTFVTRPVNAAGSVDVVVINPDGQVAVLSAGFAFTLPAPAVNALTPARAVVGGNALVVVTGVGFRDDTAVLFQNTAGTVSTPAGSVSRSSSTTLLVTTPAFTAGEARLVVRNVDGATASATFTFFTPQGPAPTIVSVSPSSGSVAGETLVTITVAGAQTPTVIFGGTSLANDAVTSTPVGGNRVALKLRSPAGTLGTTAITVINADGQSASTSFTYIDQLVPVIVGVRPALLHAGLAGDELLVFGDHFDILGPVLAANAIHGNQVRTPLRVLFSSAGFASVAVDSAVPAGDVVIELVGDNGSVRSTPLPARAPDVTRVSLTSDAVFVLSGTNLGGALLTSVRLGGVICVITSADERSITCLVSSEPGESVIELGYGDDVVSDAAFVISDRGGNGSPCDGACGGQGCEDIAGQAVCLCQPDFDPATDCQPCVPASQSPQCRQQPPAMPRTCSDVHAAFPGVGSGSFAVDIDGTGPLPPRQVECDMDFDGGGWTRVGATIANGGINPPKVDFVFSVEEISAIALLSTQVHVRTKTNAVQPERFVTSRPGTTAVQNLRQAQPMAASQEFNPNDYVGTMVDRLAIFGCQPAGPWPVVYHACGNGGGLHLFMNDQPSSRWENFSDTPHESMEVWVRDAPVPPSCEALQAQEPGITSGLYFVGGAYEFCDFVQPEVIAVVVTALDESGPGDGECSLREAVDAINTGSANGSGCLEPGAVKTIVFANNVKVNAGPLTITTPMLIAGGNHTITVSNTGGLVVAADNTRIEQLRFVGGSSNPVIRVQARTTLSEITMDTVNVVSGGAVDQAAGTLMEVQNCLFKNTTSQPALQTAGVALISQTTFDGNGSTALVVAGGGNVDVDDSMFIRNKGGNGGAVNVANTGALHLRRSALLNNIGNGSGGGAIASSGSVDITQCTLRGNSALSGVGGAVVMFNGTMQIAASTIAYNRATTSAGVRVENGQLRVKDSILSRNINSTGGSGFVDCSFGSGDAAFVGDNVFGFGNCNTTFEPTVFDAGLPGGGINDTAVASAVLRPAAGFVGATLNVGDCRDFDNNTLDADQAGTARGTAACTLGAVQIQQDPPRLITVNSGSDVPSAGLCTLREAVVAATTNQQTNGCNGGNGNADRIIFAANVSDIALSGGPIVLTEPGLTIDAVDGHDDNIVRVSAESGILLVRAATTLLGLELANTAVGLSQGQVIDVVDTSVRGEQLFLSAGSADKGAGVLGKNSVIALLSSTVAVNGAAVGEAIFLDDSAALIEHSTLSGVTSSSLIDGSGAAQLVTRHASIKGAAGAGPLINIAVARIDGSIIDAPGRSTLCSGFPRNDGTIVSSASCNTPPTLVAAGVLSRGLNQNGGRTPTIAISSNLPPNFFGSCDPGEVDQRGRVANFLCVPGAFAAVGELDPQCGDGFVDELVGTQVTPLTSPFGLTDFSGPPVVGSGFGAGGPSLLVADSAGGDFAFCGRLGCSPTRQIDAGAIAAIAVGNTNNGPEVVVFDVGGRVRLLADDGGNTVRSSTAVGSAMVSVVDAVLLPNLLGAFRDDALVVGTDGVGGTVIQYYSTGGGSFALERTVTAVANTPLRGLVVRAVGNSYQVLLPLQTDTGLIVHRIIRVVNNNTGAVPAVTLDAGGAVGTRPSAASQLPPPAATLVRGRNPVLWGASNVFGSGVLLSRGAGDVNFPGGIQATSVIAGDIDGDGFDEVVAIDDGGNVLVLQEKRPDNWQRYDGLGFADGVVLLNANPRCRLIDVGQSPQPELVCVDGNTLQILDLAPHPDETCDDGNLFSAEACTQCLVGGGP